MWRRPRRAFTAKCAGLILLAACGCTISVQPWSRQQPVAPHPVGGGVEAGGPAAPGIAPGGFQGPMPRPLPAGPPGPANNETLVLMLKQYNEVDDQRKALSEQVVTLNKQLKEQNASLRLAQHELEESSTKVKRTRDEIRQWEAEMNELRERVRKLEANRKVVGELIEEILSHLDRPGEPMRFPQIDRMPK